MNENAKRIELDNKITFLIDSMRANNRYSSEDTKRLIRKFTTLHNQAIQMQGLVAEALASLTKKYLDEEDNVGSKE